jgi:hypothetical protein
MRFDPQWLAFLIPFAVIAIRLLRARKPRRIRPGRMWILPVFVTWGIGMGLWFSPHPAITPLTVAALLAGLLAGTAVGRWRAGHIALARADDGGVLATMSPVALLFLVALFAVRQVLRAGAAQFDPALALLITDALMLLVLGMLLTQQWILWRRVQAFTRPA